MADVLVTGASGFIGWHLAQALLTRGDRVTCLVRKTSCARRLLPLGIELAYGDVTDAESLSAAVAGKSAVYHLAGMGGALQLEDLYRVNEQGAGNVARQCARQTTPPVLVFVSSLAAAGPTPSKRGRTESDPPRPMSHYGRSKMAGELAVRRFADRVPITIVRPAVVFGEGDCYCLPLFRMVCRYGLHIAPTYRCRRFSLVHADDLASLLVSAVERGERLTVNGSDDHTCDPQGLYYASSVEHPTYHRLGRIIGQAVGRPRTRVLSVGPLAVWSVAAISDFSGRIQGRPAVFSIDKAREARAGHWVCSPKKAVRQLGFSPGKPLVERLQQTAAWYRREQWL